MRVAVVVAVTVIAGCTLVAVGVNKFHEQISKGLGFVQLRGGC